MKDRSSFGSGAGSSADCALVLLLELEEVDDAESLCTACLRSSSRLILSSLLAVLSGMPACGGTACRNGQRSPLLQWPLRQNLQTGIALGALAAAADCAAAACLPPRLVGREDIVFLDYGNEQPWAHNLLNPVLWQTTRLRSTSRML